MRRLSAIVVVVTGMLTGAVGCRSTAPDATAFHHWGWENAQDAKAHLDHYKPIFLVCIYEDHWEDQGPHKYSLYHFTGTVVKIYRGDWRTSERVSFVHDVDAPAPLAPTSNAGRLMFLCTNEHTDAEIAFETGTFFNYDPQLERVFQAVCPKRNSR